MSVILVLIAFSLLVAVIFLAAFIWAVKSGQYDDDYTPSVRILFDDKQPVEKSENEQGAKAEDQSKNSTKK